MFFLIESQLFYIVYSVTLGNTTVNYAAFTSDVADATQQVGKRNFQVRIL